MNSDRSAPERSPNGCRWCGVSERQHYGRWKSGVGWHQWVAPTDEQRKERMRERRRQAGSAATRDYCSASFRASSKTSRSS
jgi:hypothetical protein